MLRLSKLTDYGIMIMSHMAQGGGSAQTAAEIATQVDVAQPTVRKILKVLARNGYLSSQRGAKGGYYLAMPAHEISLTDLIETLEGPLALTECGSRPGLCQQEHSCSIRDSWLQINQAIRHTLAGVSLEQMNRPPAIETGRCLGVHKARRRGV